MNYIHKLQAEVRSLKDQVVALEDGIHHLRDYASSDKFMGEAGYGGPTYINKLDVIHRCNDALENRFHAEAPAWFKDGASHKKLWDSFDFTHPGKAAADLGGCPTPN
jgi:hypothetical protein